MRGAKIDNIIECAIVLENHLSDLLVATLVDPITHMPGGVPFLPFIKNALHLYASFILHIIFRQQVILNFPLHFI